MIFHRFLLSFVSSITYILRMDNTIKIYQANLSNFDEALALLIRFFEEEGFTTPRKEMEKPLATMLNSSNSAVFLAIQDGSTVGIATVVAANSVEYGRVAERDDLYVLPQYRLQHIGRELIEYVKTWCRAQDCTALLVTVTPEGQSRHNLTSYYLNREFTETGRVILETHL